MKLATRLLTATLFATAGFAATSAQAADSCGWFAFAGATKSYNSAQRRADQIGGDAWGIDYSNSPNAGKGLWAIAKGPGSKSQARRWRNEYRSRGVSDAYIANRCFYGE